MNSKTPPCPCRRRLVLATAAVGGVGIVGATIPLITSLGTTNQQELAASPITVDIGQLAPGKMLTVIWRGQPIWIVHRDEKMMQQIEGHDDQLAKPTSEQDAIPDYCKNRYRAREEYPEILVVVGLCTHLGCSPIAKVHPGPQPNLPDDWPGGFLCPCHGATFDLAGRVFKNTPAPDNLKIPPYHFLSRTQIRIGEDSIADG